MKTERGSRVQQIMNQMTTHNMLVKTTKSATSYNPHRKIQLYKELVPVNREELKNTMRAHQKKSWRVSGYSKGQFTPVGFIKGKVLNNWEIARMEMSQRSYTTPKDFKGIKIKHHFSEFPTPSLDALSNNSKGYFKKCQQDYENKQLQTQSLVRTYDNKLQQFRQSMKKQFRGTNTRQSNAFGYKTATSKFRTKTFQSLQF